MVASSNRGSAKRVRIALKAPRGSMSLRASHAASRTSALVEKSKRSQSNGGNPARAIRKKLSAGMEENQSSLLRSEERRGGKERRGSWRQQTSSRRRHTRCLSDWSSDVCSSDLARANRFEGASRIDVAPREPCG